LLSLPEVPTFTEAGLPGFVGNSWQGVMAPAKTPKAIIDKLSAEYARILRTPEVRDTLQRMGADPMIGSAEQFAALIKADLVRYAKLIADAKIKLE
jgi:tripartite-type tricarboxylate transporter receptor subunit TctC